MLPPAEDPASSAVGSGEDDVVDLLPLGLVRAQLIPAAPNRRASALDWLPEFGGASWVAYGAASLLVISHFPSPLSHAESHLGPLFHQVIEPPPRPSSSPAALVNAVSWCPAVPSEGEVAAALGSVICLYSPLPGRDGSGSFFWKQTVAIEETFRVEALAWAGSGDGLIAAGSDVVLWVRTQKSWELSWRSKAKVPQSLVSATWFAKGPIATAARSTVRRARADADEEHCLSGEECGRVLVYLSDDKSGLTEVHLCHPQAVSMIQWRPSTVTQSEAGVSHVRRDVLLTCCADGTVRLWSENDNGRPRKLGRDAHSPKATRKSFHVVAVIEINNILKGILGTDTFVKWAIEFGGGISKDEGVGIHCRQVVSTGLRLGSVNG